MTKMKYQIAIALAIFTISVPQVGFAQGQNAEKGGVKIMHDAPMKSFRQRKKLIEVGWDQPTIEYVANHIKEMEASAPFDGVMMEFTPSQKGDVRFNHSHVLDRKPFRREWFQEDLDRLRKTKFTKFTDNFLRVNTYPGDLEWGDDVGWSNASTNLGHVAWLVREGNLAGIIFDSESYAAHQFEYDNKSGASKGLSFEEAQRLSRKRGAQVMKSMAKEHPQIKMLFFWGISAAYQHVRSTNSQKILSTGVYGLWPAFFNGMLDELPKGGQLIEGNEHAYFAQSRLDFMNLYHAGRSSTGPLVSLLSPESQSKYALQVKQGMCIYLDAFLNGSESPYYIGPTRDLPRVERLRNILMEAMDVSDEYVWAYGERARWWDYSFDAHENPKWLREASSAEPGRGRFWEEALPGITTAINAARDPAGSAERLIEAGTRATNRIVNPGFESSTIPDSPMMAKHPDWKGGDIPGVGFWQPDNQKGSMSWDKTGGVGGGHAAKVTGITSGVIITRAAVEPGKQYIVTGQARKKGNGFVFITVAWANENGDLIYPPRYDFTLKKQEGSEWSRGTEVVSVPVNAHYMLVFGSVRNEAATDEAWFDNIAVYDWDDLNAKR